MSDLCRICNKYPVIGVRDLRITYYCYRCEVILNEEH